MAEAIADDVPVLRVLSRPVAMVLAMLVLAER
jgi:hypothetical protein